MQNQLKHDEKSWYRALGVAQGIFNGDHPEYNQQQDHYALPSHVPKSWKKKMKKVVIPGGKTRHAFFKSKRMGKSRCCFPDPI